MAYYRVLTKKKVINENSSRVVTTTNKKRGKTINIYSKYKKTNQNINYTRKKYKTKK